jgi:hypothetical protein
VRVLTDEGRQDRHDGRMVGGRFAGDALQSVDATDAHVLFIGANLVNCLCVSISDLASFR